MGYEYLKCSDAKAQVQTKVGAQEKTILLNKAQVALLASLGTSQASPQS